MIVVIMPSSMNFFMTSATFCPIVLANSLTVVPSCIFIIFFLGAVIACCCCCC
ncbi:secreted protein [Candidatus Magnetobacterium bavaricum]|uniref:Secreted protein n=1 Tax=Candidatus Magnetobacterium bavaricum TaxID=29290 RepID=A0A0F3GV18_9BACT|nr:secreted protein [Candidatus Magnetobacterium bavaricum]